MASEWMKLVAKVYAAGKSKGMTYSQAMKEAKKQYRKTDKPKTKKKKAQKRKN